MRFIKEFPLFLGWLVSYGIAPASLWLLGSPFRGKNFQSHSELVNFLLLFIVFYLLIAFFTFMVSIKNVVIPLYQKNKRVPSEFGLVKLELHLYLLNWFLCWVYAVLFCLPLLCWATFFPVSKGIVSYTWQAVASCYLAYRFVVKQWIMEETLSHNQLTDEKPTSTA